MAANLEASHGVVFSQPVLLALVAAGLERDVAYRIVQRAARRAFEEDRRFRDVLEEEPEAAPVRAALEAAFDVGRSVARARGAIDALDALGRREEG